MPALNTIVLRSDVRRRRIASYAAAKGLREVTRNLDAMRDAATVWGRWAFERQLVGACERMAESLCDLVDVSRPSDASPEESES